MKSLNPQLGRNPQKLSNQETPDGTLNLLQDTTTIVGGDSEAIQKTISSFQKTIVGIACLSMCVTGANFFLDRQLLKTQASMTPYVLELEKLNADNTNLSAIRDRYIIYKDIYASQVAFANNASILFSVFNSDVRLTSLDITDTGFSANITSSNVYAFSRVLVALLSNKHISHVILNSANQGTDLDPIYITLEGYFK